MRGKQDHSRERSLRLDQTEAERMLLARLRSRRLQGFKFRRQHRIGPYIADFVCPECRLVIELDEASISMRSNMTPHAAGICDGRVIGSFGSGTTTSCCA